jgi:hypothetical protein
MRRRPGWMLCRSGSGTLHVSPRLASIYMRIVEIIDTEDELSAEALFDAVLDLLPVGEFPPINQPARMTKVVRQSDKG